MELPSTLLVIAVLVVIALAAVAARMVWLARLAERARDERLAALAAQQLAVRREREQGMAVIARALLDDQVGLSEACLRMAYLMEAMAWSATERANYGAILEVAAAIDHIPTHANWKALRPAERLDYERQMAAIESRHDEAVRSAARRLLARPDMAN